MRPLPINDVTTNIYILKEENNRIFYSMYDVSVYWGLLEYKAVFEMRSFNFHINKCDNIIFIVNSQFCALQKIMDIASRYNKSSLVVLIIAGEHQDPYEKFTAGNLTRIFINHNGDLKIDGTIKDIIDTILHPQYMRGFIGIDMDDVHESIKNKGICYFKQFESEDFSSLYRNISTYFNNTHMPRDGIFIWVEAPATYKIADFEKFSDSVASCFPNVFPRIYWHLTITGTKKTKAKIIFNS